MSAVSISQLPHAPMLRYTTPINCHNRSKTLVNGDRTRNKVITHTINKNFINDHEIGLENTSSNLTVRSSSENLDTLQITESPLQQRPRVNSAPMKIVEPVQETNSRPAGLNSDEEITAGMSDDDITSKEKIEKVYWVIPSMYPKEPATVLFPLVKYESNMDTNELLSVLEDANGKLPAITIRKKIIRKKSSILYFKFGPRAVEFNAVRGAFKRAGFTRLKRDDENCNFDNFTAMWSKHLPFPDFGLISDFQRINHFPGSFELGRKDSLHRAMTRMQTKFGRDYDFYPKSYAWPEAADQLKLELADGHTLFIMKPRASSCGKGIKIITKLSQIKKECIVQRYIPNPLLINEKKFDLRIYVGVTSFYPLKIYIFEEGLVRFATKPYSKKHIKDKFAHLTNYSINKHSEDFKVSEEGDSGSKWTITALKKYFQQSNIDDSKLWSRIHDIIIKTVISAEDTVVANTVRYMKSKKNCCYEIFGFDILVDDTMKPWLLEVNVSPSLSSSSPMDKRIKHRLITTLLNLVGFQIHDRRKLKQEAKQLSSHLSNPTQKVKRTIQQLRSVPLTQFESYLNDEERSLVHQFDDECRRAGMFTRLFPTTSAEYNKYFVSDRYMNELLQTDRKSVV